VCVASRYDYGGVTMYVRLRYVREARRSISCDASGKILPHGTPRFAETLRLLRYELLRVIMYRFNCDHEQTLVPSRSYISSSIFITSVSGFVQSTARCRLIIFVESPEDDSVCRYIRPYLGRVPSIAPFNWDFIGLVVLQAVER